METIIRNNESFFKIPDVHRIRPFFMSVVSHSNHWLFIASNGGLTAGRRDADIALFPYYTDDKLVANAANTGSKTAMHVLHNDAWHLWKPFDGDVLDESKIRRSLYKSIYGNKIVFEETNLAFNLVFEYEWSFSNLYGFVRSSAIKNNGNNAIQIEVLDGIQNIVPANVSADLQNRTSNLVDGYKRNELDENSGLGIYALSAIIVDKAEPSEALSANVAWSLDVKQPLHLLSSKQLLAFNKREQLTRETDIKGEPGAYFVVQQLLLQAGENNSWKIVANVNQSQSQVIDLIDQLKQPQILKQQLLQDIRNGTDALRKLVAEADGLQYSSDQLKDCRHYSNTLFNIMRGGIFDHHYWLRKSDLLPHLANTNSEVYSRNQPLLQALPEAFSYQDWTFKVMESGDADLIRLGTEYLPLKFSRRHGDPSRPWNKFSINTLSETDGSEILDYEGNWRDIFQNWEALAHAYPDFIDGMIFKFLNASTFDGYNPYRITKAGIDWESIEPDDPWSYIGYWGDHQIIYLQKLLEFKQGLSARGLNDWLNKKWFVYANVPYRIRSYEDILANPKDTIDFDAKLDHSLRQEMKDFGADAALLRNNLNQIHRVSFTEKLLAASIAKMSNFIAEAGIWMNTQRPEWNDANNALVGNGVSMVTLYYLHRHFTFIQNVFSENNDDAFEISEELAALFTAISTTFEEHIYLVAAGISDKQRKQLADALGKAASHYRNTIYNNRFSGKHSTLTASEINSYCALCLQFIKRAIRSNKRSDGLYHAYNLLTISGDEMSISYLDEMLEGQVAVLSANILSASEAVEVLDALSASKLYRKDQNSYLLYPNKNLKGFLKKNHIPAAAIEKSALLQRLVQNGDTSIVERDKEGNYHFNAKFSNANFLADGLKQLQAPHLEMLSESERALILDIYEQVFNHKAFTGRSGTFFAFEGLGSIYWHMVSKLHLAIAEVWEKFALTANESTRTALKKHFENVEAGIGVHKAPEVYGAFPTDPYSHTPWHKGAQQPGMTGQVKEDILVNRIALGIQVENGCIRFNPTIVDSSLFTNTPSEIEVLPVGENWQTIQLDQNQLLFTCCQVPVTYQLAESTAIVIKKANNEITERATAALTLEESEALMKRSGEIAAIKVFIDRKAIQAS